MKSAFVFLIKRLLSGRMLSAVLIPASLVMFAGAGFAVNAVMNPPQPMTGRPMIEKYLIDGFQRDRETAGFLHSRVVVQTLKRQSMTGFRGYAWDEIAMNRHPRLAYRSGNGLQTPGPMPMLQSGTVTDLQHALDIAVSIAAPGAPRLRTAVARPGNGTTLHRTRRGDLPETRSGPTDAAQLGFRPGDGSEAGRAEDSGPQINFRPHPPESDRKDPDEPSPVPLPEPFWMLLVGLVTMAGVRFVRAGTRGM